MLIFSVLVLIVVVDGWPVHQILGLSTYLHLMSTNHSINHHSSIIRLDNFDEQDQMEIITQSKNQKSKFSFMKSFVPYFKSEWSFAQFRLTDTGFMKVAFG